MEDRKTESKTPRKHCAPGRHDRKGFGRPVDEVNVHPHHFFVNLANYLSGRSPTRCESWVAGAARQSASLSKPIETLYEAQALTRPRQPAPVEPSVFSERCRQNGCWRPEREGNCRVPGRPKWSASCDRRRGWLDSFHGERGVTVIRGNTMAGELYKLEGMRDIEFDTYLDHKAQQGSDCGFEPTFIPDQAMDYQSAMIEWSVRKGRAAIFEDCGMGKTLQALAWAQNVVDHTGKPVMILTPLAVAAQTIREGEKFGIEASRERSTMIHVTNYQQLGKFDPFDYAGVVCDESSILKSFDGSLRQQITDFMRKTPYRLLCTATAAPNDYVELGTSSEALGYLGHMDMLGRFFKNDQGNIATRRMYGEATKWRFKGHAERPFWRWVCSWARALRRPSDLGFDDGPLRLPSLSVNRHRVDTAFRPEGMLFDLPATTLPEQRAEQKATVSERCEMAASLVDHDQPAIVWCHLDAESSELTKRIPGSVEVAGKHSDEQKEERFERFLSGDSRVLVTKPKIGAWGLNFQHCAHVVYFPSHSFEQYYQAVRRCWRFGQQRPVGVDVIYTTGQERVLENLERKARQAETMFGHLVEEMNSALSIDRRVHDNSLEIPSWIQ